MASGIFAVAAILGIGAATLHYVSKQRAAEEETRRREIAEKTARLREELARAEAELRRREMELLASGAPLLPEQPEAPQNGHPSARPDAARNGDVFDALVAEVNALLAERRYGAAAAAARKFADEHGEQPMHDMAVDFLGRLNNSLLKHVEEQSADPNRLVNDFLYDEAVTEYQHLAARFEGTPWKRFLDVRTAGIKSQQALHSEAIRRLKDAARNGTPVPLPFEMPELPGLKLLVADADPVWVTFVWEKDSRYRRGFQWKALPPKNVCAIYSACIPAPTPAQHEMFGLFCQERDLIDEAEKHFTAAERNDPHD